MDCGTGVSYVFEEREVGEYDAERGVAVEKLGGGLEARCYRDVVNIIWEIISL